MTLLIQIKSLIFSFLYGIFFAFTYKLNYKYLMCNIKILKTLLSFFFIFDHVLLYFILLSLINNGILHLYFLITFILGNIFFVYLFDNNKKIKLTKKNSNDILKL